MEMWPTYKARGEWRFILLHYGIVRGTILFAVAAGPLLPTVSFTTATGMIIFASIIPLVLLLLYTGNETWVSCEQDYEIQILREAAERTRIGTN